jgi:Dna[CI] antecedent, DciA
MAELVERWPEAVGAEIARFAWPARIARDGTVHVSTADSVWAFELGHRAAEIGARLGGVQLRFAPGPLPESSVPPAADVVVPSDEDDARAGELTAAMTHAELRETVQKALSFALARGRFGPPF